MSGRVLVVDDEVEMQRALRTGLGYHDFDVHAVGSGEEAMTEAAAWRPDVILLDLGLPGMDGFATLKALRPATRAAVSSSTRRLTHTKRFSPANRARTLARSVRNARARRSAAVERSRWVVNAAGFK